MIDDQSEICNLLSNEYILEKSSSDINLISDEVDEYCKNYIIQNPDYKMKSITTQEVLENILNIKKCNNSKGNIPICIYKKFAQHLCKPIILLFMTILNYSEVPDSFKTVDCFPLYKGKGSKSQAGSYRAIFNLSFLTKVFEKIIFYRLSDMVDEILCDAQHGFRRRRSCETAVSLLSQNVHNIIDKRKGKVLALFIDFRKAFDSVNRYKLMQKLMCEFKVEPYIIKLFKDYFLNRKFRIVNGIFKSSYFTINNGVPPGSSLGGILFSIFINSISSIITLPHYLYADDLVIFVDATNITEGNSQMQKCIDDIENWCNENNIDINVDKTKAMYFFKANDYRSRQEIESSLEMLKVNGNNVEFVNTFKYLGVWLDSSLDFKEHIIVVEKGLIVHSVKCIHINTF